MKTSIYQTQQRPQAPVSPELLTEWETKKRELDILSVEVDALRGEITRLARPTWEAANRAQKTPTVALPGGKLTLSLRPRLLPTIPDRLAPCFVETFTAVLKAVDLPATRREDAFHTLRGLDLPLELKVGFQARPDAYQIAVGLPDATDFVFDNAGYVAAIVTTK